MAAYKKLPGKGQSDFSIYTLWMGDDHLLSVSRQGSREYYKRFRLADIQALTLEPNMMWIVAHAIMGVLTFVALGFCFYFFNSPSDAGQITYKISQFVTGGMVLGWIWVALRGTTCTCRIKTAAQHDCLYSLTHTRPARKTFNLIRAAIEQTQGPFTLPQTLETESNHPTTLDSSIMESVTPSSAPPLRMTHHPHSGADFTSKPLTAHCTGTYHIAFFICLMVDFVDSCLRVALPTYEFPAPFTGVFVVGLLTFVSLAVARQSNTDLPDRIQRITWAGAIYVFLCIVKLVMVGFLNEISSAAHEDFGNMEFNSVARFVFSSLSALVAGPISVFGWMWTNEFRRKSMTPPPLPPPPA